MAWHPFRNIGLKIAALGLGALLWVTVSGQQVERNVLVQLQFRNIPGALELTGDTPRTVDVRVRGAAGLISALEPYQVIATVDLTDTRPGFRIFPLTTEQISVPLGVEVKSVDPSTIALTLERSGSARVPVKPTIDGEPAPGYEITQVTWQPQSVDVVGPESRLKDLPAVITERISVEGATSTITETVSLGVTDSAVRLRQGQSARVTVRIAPGPVLRLPDCPITFRNVPAGRHATAEPAAVAVSLRGAQAVLDAASRDGIEPYIDVVGLAPGTYELQPHTDAQGEYLVLGVEPRAVRVTIK